MTTSSGYLREGSKSNGLCSTPSIVAPSWLFHETISSVLLVQPPVCALVSVSFLVRLKPDATYSSDIDFASERRYAYVLPSFVNEKLEFTAGSAAVTLAIALVATSRR